MSTFSPLGVAYTPKDLYKNILDKSTSFLVKKQVVFDHLSITLELLGYFKITITLREGQIWKQFNHFCWKKMPHVIL